MAQVQHLFGDQMQGMIELAWTEPTTGALSRAQLFDVGALDELIDCAYEKNSTTGQNVYIGAALRKPGTFPAARAEDDDYLATVAAYVDLDDAAAASAAKERYGACKATLAVITGNVPAIRGQLWWKLEQPVQDAEDHRKMMVAAAAHFQGDVTVVNPSRVMRLGGSIAWPFKPGRVAEMTAVQIPQDGRPRVVFRQEIEAAFPSAQVVGFYQAPPNDNPLDFNTAGPQRGWISGKLSADWLLAEIQGGRLWHMRMNQLVGHWIMRNWSNAEILNQAAGLTNAGWTVDQTAREMLKSIEGGRKKWQKPEVLREFDPETGSPGDVDQKRGIQFLDMDQINQLQPPTYAIDKLITEQGFTLIWGKQASFKSFFALDMALHMAYGRPFHGRETLPKRVLYIAGEGASGFKNRIGAWRKHYGQAAKGDFYMLATGINMIGKAGADLLIAAIHATNAPFDYIFVDTVARAMLGAEENDASAMGLFIQACDMVRAAFGCGLGAVHHSGKDSGLGPRGSTALPAAVDTDFLVERAEGTQLVTITCKKQKDDEEPAPFRFKAEKIDVSSLGIAGQSSLVMVPGDGAIEEKRELSKAQVDDVLREIDCRWKEKKPWSLAFQTRKEGRFLPMWMSRNYPMSAAEAQNYIEQLLVNGFLTVEIADAKTKVRGLRVLKYHNQAAEVAEVDV